ncbi:MAG: glycosyltransferase family 4 protein [Dehalococcoidia bacterium]|nr:glycosyltransferase family 4 protein [Dehalococcoidia bacterium]
MTEPIALCLEQTLGHRMHGQNLEAAVARAGEPATVVHVDFPERTRMRVPWAVRGSAQARSRLKAQGRRFGAVLYHTQTISLFARQASGGAPYVVSVDATPRQLDTLGSFYRHKTGPGPVEAVKAAWYRHVFGGAAGFVAWSEWAARSLRADYGVRAPVVVAHPGAPRRFFEIERREHGGRPRILFVGGDFERKGGPELLEAFAPLANHAELLLVTEAAVEPRPGVTVLRGVRPGSPEQLAAFAGADLFCLPTRGDCTPVAIGEALAAGLPVVTTSVGSNAETLGAGEAGRIVPVHDAAALRDALEELIDDTALRHRLARNARALAAERYDAAANAARVLELLRGVAA